MDCKSNVLRNAEEEMEEELNFLRDQNGKLQLEIENQRKLIKQSNSQVRKYEQILNKFGAGLERLSNDFSERISSLMNELLDKEVGENETDLICEIFEDLTPSTLDGDFSFEAEHILIKKETNHDDAEKTNQNSPLKNAEPPMKKRKVEKNLERPNCQPKDIAKNVLVLGTDWLAQTDHSNKDNLTFTTIDCPACLLEIEPEEVLFRLPCSHSHHLECLQRIIQSRFLSKKCCSCQVPINESTGEEITRAIKQMKKEKKKTEKDFCMLLLKDQH